MAGGCRDCARCTERGVTSLAALPVRILYAVFVGWWAGLFQKKCPICGHRMNVHSQRQAAVGDS